MFEMRQMIFPVNETCLFIVQLPIDRNIFGNEIVEKIVSISKHKIIPEQTSTGCPDPKNFVQLNLTP